MSQADPPLLQRLAHLPLRALGRAARAVQRAEAERQSRQGPLPVAASAASLRVGSPMDVPPEVDVGELSTTAAEVLGAQAAGQPLTLVDVRNLGEHRRARPAGALHMPDERAVIDLAEIPAGHRAVVVGDKGGAHARRVAAFLRYRGLDDTWVLDGGFPAWQAAGGAVERG
ncbi:rhodanese-like domain-containing protein [Myxococcota bacterium]|nr:rhodanese-like domain-containing protein [Myxococcota bacterium]